MSNPHAILLWSLVGTLVAGNCCGGGESTNEVSEATPRTLPRINTNTAAKLDDLGWLLGRWRCVSRQYLTKEEAMLAPGETLLDYFNVYFPYADDRLTLDLTDNPEDRPIAAEFLGMHVWEIGGFREQRGPMFEGGLVRISKDRIWYGSPLSEDFNFKYSTETRYGRRWLILESRAMRFELCKLDAPVGDLRQSCVVAPIKDYSPERIQGLNLKYAKLVASLPGSSRRSADR
jgi:hypothetical protein